MVELLLQIARAEDDRLHGTARLTTAAEAQAFSGMLELMRVLEELVPGTGHHFPRAGAGADRVLHEGAEQERE